MMNIVYAIPSKTIFDITMNIYFLNICYSNPYIYSHLIEREEEEGDHVVLFNMGSAIKSSFSHENEFYTIR